MKGNLDGLKKALNFFVVSIWICNSTFTALEVLIKIIEFIKKKRNSKKVVPEEKKEIKLEITSLET